MKISPTETYSTHSNWFQLTALWAFVEVTLGGLLHAIRLPLTGLVVGGSAVAILCAMAYTSKNIWKDIVRATGVVLVVKAGASPHSPIPAYLAVSFQGFAAALLFSIIRNYKLATVVFAVLAMLESALQKLLTLVIMYGKSLKYAIDVFSNSLVKELHLDLYFHHSSISAADGLAVIYISLYVLWGCVLGFRMAGFPNRIASLQEIVKTKSKEYKEVNTMFQKRIGNGKYVFWLVYAVVLVSMILILSLVEDSKHNLYYVLLRSLSATILLFIVINPLFNFWVKRKAKKNHNAMLVNDITQHFMQFRIDYKFSLYCVEKKQFLLLRYIRAMEFMIAIRLKYQEIHSENSPKP